MKSPSDAATAESCCRRSSHGNNTAIKTRARALCMANGRDNTWKIQMQRNYIRHAVINLALSEPQNGDKWGQVAVFAFAQPTTRGVVSAKEMICGFREEREQEERQKS